jgi:hypothetical protein
MQILTKAATALSPLSPLADVGSFVITFLAFIAAIIAIVYAKKAFDDGKAQLRQQDLQIKDSKTQLKRQVYHDLMSEYRTPLMLKALTIIGDIGKENEKKDKVAAAVNFRNHLSRNPLVRPYYRMIMQYYYEVALIAKDDEFTKKLFFEVWNKKSLSIIQDVIIPHETHKAETISPSLIPTLQEQSPDEKHWKKVLRYLKWLHDEAPDDNDLD